MNKVTFNDRWIVEEVFKGMKNGFFIEAGAWDGRAGSCTYVLEKELDWTGILIEPMPLYFTDLKNNRPNSICVNKGLSSYPGSLEYYHFDGWAGYNGFPSLNKFGEAQWWDKVNSNVKGVVPQKYNIECVTLYNTLIENNAPKVIDYLCLDTEGSELEILKNFPFDKYKFKTISIEFSPQPLTDILIKNDYMQVTNSFSDGPWEHYFIHKDYLKIEYMVNDNIS
jgi:FkbM family methyltransferase